VSESDANVQLAARRIRQIGVEHVLFGSDLDPAVPPKLSWATFRMMLPLTEDEFRAIADNALPYLH
jgi:hypothetical protein